jgi:hypothetical protein
MLYFHVGKGVFMNSNPITRYAFRIRTRLGIVVDNLMIHGRDEFDAQKKLRQMYRGCEVIDCVCHRGSVRVPVNSFEDVANLIAR